MSPGCRVIMDDFMTQRGIQAPGCLVAMDGKHWRTCMGKYDDVAFRDVHEEPLPDHASGG